MKWIFGKGIIEPGGLAGKGYNAAVERPAIISDDGVTVVWRKTIPEANIFTLVYQKNSMESVFYIENNYIEDDLNVSVIGVSAPRQYYQIKHTCDGSFARTSYTPSPEEIEDVKQHLREALPLWSHSPKSPFGYPPEGAMIVVV